MGCYSKIARCSAVVVEVFSEIMQELLKKTSIPASAIRGIILANDDFKETLSETDVIAIQTLTTNEFTKLEFTLIYKIAKFFRFISEPSQRWGTKPLANMKKIGDDIERMRLARYDLVCRSDREMTDTELNACFGDFVELGKRMDVYLGKPQYDGFVQTIINYKTCRMDDRLEEKYVKALREIASESKCLGNSSTDDYRAVGASIQNMNIEQAQVPTFKTESELLYEFNLDKFYPNKITLFDIIKVLPADSNNKISDIPWVFLESLFSLNFTARDKIIEEFSKRFKNIECLSGECGNQVDFLDDLLGNGALSSAVNPTDMTVAIFKCCSPMVKQIVASKMFMCRLAIPFVFPQTLDESMLISVWPIRPIVIEEETSSNNAVDCPCSVVSFVRMGYTSVSKSRMINEIISDHHHSSFFNRDCPMGSNKRWTSNGLIEMSWYIPSMYSRLLSNVTVCLNLRGDIDSFEQQVKFMTHFSDAIVIMVEVQELNKERFMQLITDVYSTQVMVILSIDAIQYNKGLLRNELHTFMSRIKQFQNRTRINILTVGGNVRCFADLKEEMRNYIKELLLPLDLSSLGQRLQTDTCKQMQLDLNQNVYSTMKAVSDKITSCITIMSSSTKTELLPLQGKPWKEWSQHLKHVKKTSLYKTLLEHGLIEKKMNEARITQLEICNNLGPFMETFIKTVTQILPSKTKLTVLFIWLKMFFDEQSRNILPTYLARYKSAWQELNEASAENTQRLQLKLRNCEYELAEASFGFEHLCREMGQMYEAIYESRIRVKPELQSYREILPQIGANLLLLGFSFELMDGDTATVPFNWIKAVLEELRKSTKEKQFLILSVLGLQSSGKSTLLNTMFGLQFAVSAGRCTRGVFMQLVPVLDETKAYDYVLVLDTEGLRAPELGYEKYRHDNELATFVVGLGDITIVNVKGENTVEVHDILQIVVHAFLRLRLANERLNMKKKCVFIHQNVSAADAKTSLMQQRKKLVETLDKKTQETAEEENIRDIKTFSQVINFDSNTNVWYFPDIWYGDPPMAPANPGYSKCVQRVKDALIFPSLVTKSDSYLTITNTISRIYDLWEGILKDDFVFSFRNSVERKAYHSMEKKCQELKWSLEKFVLSFTRSKAKIDLLKCENDSDLDKEFTKIVANFSVQTEKEVNRLCTELDIFVDQSTLKDSMIQWTEAKKNAFKIIEKSLVLKAKSDVRNTKEEIKIQRLKVRERTNHEREINELATKLAVEMHGMNPSSTELEERFDHVWKSWINKLNLQDDIEISPIAIQIENLLRDQFPGDTAFFVEDKSKAYSSCVLEGSITPDRISSDHYKRISTFGIFKPTEETCRIKIVEIIDKIFVDIDSKLLKLKSKDMKFDIFDVTKIMNKIVKIIDDHNKHDKNDYKFDLLPPFRAMIVNHVAKNVTPFFVELNERYNKMHSPKEQMAFYRCTAWELFVNLVKQKTKNVTVVLFLRKAIIQAVEEHVIEMLPIDVQDYMLGIFSSKFSLMKDIMVYLAETGSFEQYKAYISDPISFAKAWIKRITNETMFEGNGHVGTKYADMANCRIHYIFCRLLKSINEATTKCDQQGHSNLSNWLGIFLTDVEESNYLPLSNISLTHVHERKDSYIRDFPTMFRDDLMNTEKIVLLTFQTTTQSTVKWNESPIPKIMNKVWGCEEYCMFCNEPCKNTDKDHVAFGFPHQCIQHRPMGINGTHKSNTDKLVVEFCNYNVSTDQTYTQNKNMDTKKNYKDYKTYHPDWDILPSSDVSRYWMWVLCKYQRELAQLHDVKLPDIPKQWWDIDQAEAIKSISSTY